MLVLLDHGTPRGLARELAGHTIVLAKSRGWDRLANGDLLKAAEEAGFNALLTTDANIRYQQNLRNRRIAIIVLTGTTRWTRVRMECKRIASALEETAPGSYAEVLIPSK
jgi:hypothetical protein